MGDGKGQEETCKGWAIYLRLKGENILRNYTALF